LGEERKRLGKSSEFMENWEIEKAFLDGDIDKAYDVMQKQAKRKKVEAYLDSLEESKEE
jgi:hypothetical protein